MQKALEAIIWGGYDNIPGNIKRELEAIDRRREYIADNMEMPTITPIYEDEDVIIQ